MIKKGTLALALFCSQTALADDYFSLPLDWNESDTTPLLLASNDDMNMTTSRETDTFEYKDRMFTANKVHKYLGIGSIAAAGLTLLMPKEEDGAHEALGTTAAALGTLAVITGITFHWEDLNFSNGFKDPDVLHATLTTLGTAGYLYAVSEAPEPHGGVGALGAVSMAIGIKMVW